MITSTPGGIFNSVGFDLNSASATNAAAALTIPTYDGSGQCVHPDVYDAGLGATWNGHRYWMAFTPYPSANDDYENPSIVVSEDGTAWAVPDGLTNPVEAKPAVGYNSDPDLIRVGDTLWLIFRYTDGSTLDKIYARSSTDGVTWTEKVELFSSGYAATLSPAVVQVGGQFVMYTIDASAATYYLKRRTASAITGPWSSATTCTLPLPLAGYQARHLDMIYSGTHYLGLFMETDTDAKLILGQSSDGLDFTMAKAALLSPKTGAWDDAWIYRGCMVRTATGLNIWYSAKSSGNVWGIGKTSTNITYNG